MGMPHLRRKDNAMVRDIAKPRHFPAFRLITTTFTHTVLVVILLGFFNFILPRFVESYDSFDVDLPLVTQKIMVMSQLVQGHFQSVSAGAILFLIAEMMIYFQFLRMGHRSLATLWSTLILLAGAGAVLACFAAALLPLLSNVETLLSG
jgi:hypothetical protein